MKVVIVLLFIIAVFFAFRYFKLVYGLYILRKDLEQIRQDLTQNNVLYLPFPEKELEKLFISVNSFLEKIQVERKSYQKRERDFQKQIENISHDLRTPLTVILGYLKFITSPDRKEQLCSSKDLYETLMIIEHKAETMNELVGQFYDYSRLTADDYKMELTTVDIARVLREAVLGNYQLLEQKKLEITVDIPEHAVQVLGNDSELERIFQNLFQNVSRYADSILKIGLKEEKKTVKISFVNDTCILSEEDISHLFERFYMQDQSRNQGGTGLGLTVAKNLAEEMNGNLGVEVLEQSLEEKMMVCFTLILNTI